MGELCPGAIPNALKELRAQLLEMLPSRLYEAVTAGELSFATNTDHLARFVLAVYQGISTQARDGATTEELNGIAMAAMTAWPLTGVRKNDRVIFGAVLAVRNPISDSY